MYGKQPDAVKPARELWHARRVEKRRGRARSQSYAGEADGGGSGGEAVRGMVFFAASLSYGRD